MARGILVALEGVDGAGKTTQTDRLVAHLERLGRGVVRTKEPTNGPIGQKIRATARTGRLPPDEELALFMDDRRSHVSTLIRPALERGDVVVVDRYYLSTVAYQGARGFDWRDLLARNEAIAPEPDLLVVLDIDVSTGLDRVNARPEGADSFERRDLLELSADIFRQLTGPHVLRVDATRAPDDVEAEIWSRLTALDPSLS